MDIKLNFVQRLNKAITAQRKFTEDYHKQSAWMMKNYVSGHAEKIVGPDPHPMNMIDRIVSIWLPFLVGGIPKVLIKPRINLKYYPFAYTFQLAINQWMADMKFDERTLEKAVFNSLFSVGITKTGTQRANKRELSGYLTVTGTPYSEVVEATNYVFDIAAKDREQYEFEGDEYLLRTDVAKERFPDFADRILPDYKLYGDEHPKSQSNTDNVKYDELHEYTGFIDLWLPKEKVIITILPPHRNFNHILKTTDYKGRIGGPYDILGYKYHSGSTLPIPPVYGLMELDAAINKLYAKARDQAERLKRIGAYEGGDEKDADTAKKARDGDMCGFNNMQSVKEVQLGGISPEIWDFLGYSQAQISEQGGITGLDYKMRSKTLGQEQMLQANAGRTLDMMSQKVHAFASNIAMKLAFEMWQNPTLQIEATKKMAGIGQVTSIYNQLEQEGRFPGDYYLDIEMFSMQRLSARETFQNMMQMLTGFTLPMAQQLAQQGKIVNAEEIHNQLANYINIDTETWFLNDMPAQEQMNPYQQMSSKTKSSDQRFGAGQGDNQNNLLAQLNKNKGAA